jgi:ABC-2 type transport system permease protein
VKPLIAFDLGQPNRAARIGGRTFVPTPGSPLKGRLGPRRPHPGGSGALSFCAPGYALASVVRSEDAAQPITQAVTLPLYFISGVFVAVTALPAWLVNIAGIFPVRHLAAALLAAYNPNTQGSGFSGADLLAVAAWGIGGLLVSLRRFSWVPLGR